MATSCERRRLNIDFFVPDLGHVQRDYPEFLMCTNGFVGLDGDYDISYEMFSYNADRPEQEIVNHYLSVTNWSLMARDTNTLILTRYSPDHDGIAQAWVGFTNNRVLVAILSRRVPLGAKRLEDSKWKPLAKRIESKFLVEMKNMKVQQSGPAYPPQGVGSADP